MTTNGKSRIGAVLVLAAALAAAAGVTTQRAESRPRATVVIGYLAVEPTMQAAYADARGFFARHGIDAELKPFTDPSLIPAAVLSGDVTFSAFNIGGLANLKASGAPVKLVASGALYRPNAPTTSLLVARGRTITRARQLVGKKIGIDVKTGIAAIGLLKWLKRNGISEDDVTLVEFRGFAPMLGPLRRGQIDAAVMPEPYRTLARQRGARSFRTIFDAVCRTDCLITIWMARRDIDRDLAARFRNAIQDAGVWANQKRNAEASARIFSRQTSLSLSLVRTITRTTFATRLRPAQAQPWIDAYVEFGVIPASFQAIELVK
jgi:NitT/TauT family transport system substrate-binding protein